VGNFLKSILPSRDDINTTDVYDWTLISKKRIVINQGGTSSSKTYSILQVLLTYLIYNPDPVLISVVSETLPHLRRGAMRDFLKMLIEYGIYNEKFHNKSDNTYTIGKNVIEFFSADNPAKIRGARRDILYINECNNVPWEVFDQLEVRTKLRVFLDYNPVSEFWVNEQLIGKSHVSFHKSTFIHNLYLDPRIKASILTRKAGDPNWWKVYGEGEMGTKEGVIYTNWFQSTFFPTEVDSVWYGLDFGFTNDPSALIKTCVQGGELWVQEMFYETGMTNKDISLRMEQAGLKKNEDFIIADSAEPKSIYELRQNGWLIKGVTKGADSVNQGIQLVRQYKLNVTQDSVNMIKELRNYKWEQDKMTGKPINVPIDAFNHALDALRYGCMAKLGRRSFVMEQEN
jgi:phage terminase large subunit